MDHMGIDDQICRWQLNKDSEEADRLIQAYLPFIIKTLSKAAGRFIDPAQDDEYSIGLQAFYEAMQRFDRDNGKFLPFAQLVMISRVKSWWKQNRKHGQLSLDDLEIEPPSVTDLAEDYCRAEDILLFIRQLQAFGLTPEDLVKATPQRRDVRENLLEIACRMSLEQDLMDTMKLKHRLPIQAVARRLSINAQMIKRHKVYLLAAALVYSDPQSMLAQWLGKCGAQF